MADKEVTTPKTSEDFFELLAACIKEDGAEAIQASLENVPGPSNEEFFGEIILEGMKKEIRRELEEALDEIPALEHDTP